MKGTKPVFMAISGVALVVLLCVYFGMSRPVAVKGVITDSNTKPVVGARILLQTVTADNQPAQAEFLEDSKTTSLRIPRLPGFWTQTDSGGRYCQDVPAGRYSLVVYAPEGSGLVGAQKRGVDITDKIRNEYDFALVSSASVKGTVRDKTGMPVANSQVWLTQEERSCPNSLLEYLFLSDADLPTTDKQGRFAVTENLPAGKYSLVIVPPEGKCLASYVENINCVSGAIIEKNVVMPESIIVTGSVVDSKGKPAAKAHVLLRGAKGVIRVEAEVASDGEYRICERICPGQYAMSVIDEDGTHITNAGDLVVPEETLQLKKDVLVPVEAVDGRPPPAPKQP